MSVVSAVVAAIGFALAVLWCGVGVAGLTGRLQRNKWLGVRNDDTMRSAKAFTVANRAAAPGMLAAGGMTALGAALSLAVGGVWGLVFAIAAIVVSLLVIGVVSGLGIRAAALVPVEDDEVGGCSAGCCSGDAAPSSCATSDVTGDSSTERVDAGPAADCGQASCGSCALSGLCTDEASQA